MHESSRRRRRTARNASVALSALVSGAPATAAAATSSRHLRGRSASESALLHPRHRQRPRRAESEETNDDDRTVLPLHPLSLKLSGLPSASPLLTLAAADANVVKTVGNGGGGTEEFIFATYSTTTDAAMDNLLQYVSDVGTRAFNESEAYGGRFEEWDVGTVWSVSSEFVEGSASLPWGKSISAEARSNEVPPAASPSTTVLTLGHNGTITLKGAYWDDSRELTEYLAQEMNSDAIRRELLNRLRSLACDAGDLIGNTCDVRVEAASSDVAPAVQSAEFEGGEDAQGATAAEGNEVAEPEPLADAIYAGEMVAEPKPPVDGNDSDQEMDTEPDTDANSGSASPINAPGDEINGEEGTPIPIDEVDPILPAPEFIDTSTNTLEAMPSDSSYPSLARSQGADQEGANDESKLQMIIPVVIASFLVALLVAGLLHRRRRNKRRRELAREDELNTTDETEPTEAMPSAVASDAYDAITSPTNKSFPFSGKKKGGESSTAASPTMGAAGAAVAASVNNKPSTKKASKTLDEVLDSFDDGSSFVSDSSASQSNANVNDSVFGSLTDMLGGSPRGSPTPLDDAEFNDRMMAVKQPTPGLTAKLEEGRNNNAAAAATSPRSVQKPEDFEGAYRSRSAMHTMNLKKDILHVACDTHDANTSTTTEDHSGLGSGIGLDSAIGNLSGAPSNLSEQALGESYGVTRTISPKKSAVLNERQRNAERLGSLRARSRYFNSVAKGDASPSKKNEEVRLEQMRREEQKRKEEQKKKELKEERETSKDLILPVGFKRSDSVDLVSKSASDISSEDDIGCV